MNAVDKLKKAKQGDLKAIEQLCSATWEPLYRYIYYKVQNREEAEDITQESYVKMLKYFHKHQAAQDNFLGLIKTIALNVIRDRWRQKQRRGTEVHYEDINPVEAAESDHQKAVTQRLQLEKAMAELSADQQAILELRIVKGYSAAETAKLVGKTEAAVRTAQHRALQALAQLLEIND